MSKSSNPKKAHGSTGSAARVLTTGLPTLAGKIPHGLEHAFQSVPAPTPELTTLPAPGARCPITGRSRTWLVESGEEARRDGKPFLFRIRQRGKTRGAVFVRVPVLLAWIAKREAEDNGREGEAV